MGLSTWMKQISKVEGAVPSASPVEAVMTEIAAASPKAPVASVAEGAASRWTGFIDRVGSDAIHGWAYDASNPTASVTVEAVTASGKTTVALANLLREDVASAGYGTGRYGYVLDLRRLALKDETVIVRFADNKYPISREPIDFDAQRALLTQSMPAAFTDNMLLLAAQIRLAAEPDRALQPLAR